MPEISIILPVYNGQQYLHACLDSILCQTFNNYEVIIVDDGSTDQSGIICDEYGKIDSRFSVLHVSNGGVSAARNIGINSSKGKYITFVDCDDSLNPEYLNRLYDLMRPRGIVVCDYCDLDSPITCEDNNERFENLTKDEFEICLLKSSGFSAFPWGKLFDRSIIHSGNIVFNEELTICEDLLFCMEYIAKSDGPLVHIGLPLYYYRKNDNGALSSRYSKVNRKNICEYRSIILTKKYINNTSNVIENWKLRSVKAATNDLRTMAAYNDEDSKLYRQLLMYIRKNILFVLFAKGFPINSKISVLLAAISPKLEFYVWKKRN
jgi:glycosyltransferase involved in cell wall biosynthesis